MIFTRRYKYDKSEIKLNGKVIEYVETFKYLGVTFDNTNLEGTPQGTNQKSKGLTLNWEEIDG